MPIVLAIASGVNDAVNVHVWTVGGSSCFWTSCQGTCHVPLSAPSLPRRDATSGGCWCFKDGKLIFGLNKLFVHLFVSICRSIVDLVWGGAALNAFPVSCQSKGLSDYPIVTQHPRVAGHLRAGLSVAWPDDRLASLQWKKKQEFAALVKPTVVRL